MQDLKVALAALKKQSDVSPSRDEVGEKDDHTALSNLSIASRGFSTTYGPTPLHQRALNQAKELLDRDSIQLDAVESMLSELISRIEANGVSVM